MHSSSKAGGTKHRRRSASQSTSESPRTRGRRSSQTFPIQAQGQPARANSTGTWGAIPRLASNALSYVMNHLPRFVSASPAPAPSPPRLRQIKIGHTCGRYEKVETRPDDATSCPGRTPPPTFFTESELPSGSVFTERGLFNLAMHKLGLGANSDQPPCPSCKAERQPRVRHPMNETKSQNMLYPELIHKGYEMIYHPAAPLSEGDDGVDDDFSNSETVRRVRVANNLESFNGSEDESSSLEVVYSSDEDEDEEWESTGAGRRKKRQVKGKEGRKEKKKKGKEYRMIGNRDLSPDSRKAREVREAVAKEVREKMDEIGLMFQPTWNPGAGKGRRDDDASDDGGAGSGLGNEVRDET